MNPSQFLLTAQSVSGVYDCARWFCAASSDNFSKETQDNNVAKETKQTGGKKPT